MPDYLPLAAAETTLADRISRSLSYRYGFILICIGLLLGIDQALLQPRLLRLSVVAPRINVAGRQRMLSQKLAKEALAIRSTADDGQHESRRNEFRNTLELWRQSHLRLLSDDPEVGLASSSSAIAEEFRQLESDFQAMSQAANALLAETGADSALLKLLDHEQQYLPRMDRIVGLYESEARDQAATLRRWGLAASASVLALIVGLGLVVLRPATKTIQRQMEGLEEHVSERTAELTATNASLLREMHTREQAEARNRELSNQLAHLSRVLSLGQLATGLAHEINQPLAAIVNYAETCDLLLSKETPDVSAVQRAVSAIGKAACRAGDVIRSMRNFLRPGRETQSDVDLNDLVHDVVLLCRPELLRHEIALHLELDPALSPLPADAVQIQQVMLNLIQNAIQAMQDSPSSNRMLRITVQRIGDEARVEFADNGPGFGGRDSETLFAPFYTTKDSGLGMGLAIVRSIVQAHGGTVHAESRRPGAVVSFTMPLDLEHAQRAADESHCLCG